MFAHDSTHHGARRPRSSVALLSCCALVASAAVAATRPARPRAAAQVATAVTATVALGSPAARISLAGVRPVVAGGIANAASGGPPRSLAAADFDEDGVPDLAVSYGGEAGGHVVVLRGDADAISPNAPEAARRRAAGGDPTGAPFLSGARSFDVPAAADTLAAGDFDADGHADLALAARGTREITLLSGDGRGGFAAPRTIALQGELTALACGEANRRDGLPDLVACVRDRDGAAALVFEGPDGALAAEPERVALPSPAADVAVADLDGDGFGDVAVAAGHDLVVVRGRDRRLSLDETRRASVAAPQLARMRFDAPLVALAAGRFAAGPLAALTADGAVAAASFAPDGAKVRLGRTLLSDEREPGATALVRVKLSTGPDDDLIVVGGASRSLRVLAGADGGPEPVDVPMDDEVAAVLPMRLGGDALTDLVAIGRDRDGPFAITTAAAATFTVTTTSDSGAGSLRQAILDANASPGADAIVFAIAPGGGPFTIAPLSPLPEIVDPVTIDATTQPGYAGTPFVALDGAHAGGGVNGLLVTAGHSAVRGLCVDHFDTADPNGLLGGIRLAGAGGDVVEGCFVGTDPSGAIARPNTGTGIVVAAPGSVVGGTVAAARNVVSGNGGAGVHATRVASGPIRPTTLADDGSGSIVEGNFVGTDATGTRALGNVVGVSVDCAGVTVGGAIAGARDVISGNDEGLVVGDTAALVQDSYFGTDASGRLAVSNLDRAITIADGASDATVGGTTPAARNVISANHFGVVILGAGGGDLVQGDFVGTDATGTTDLGNEEDGVFVAVTGGANTVGGAVAGARNVISGNDEDGVDIESANASQTVQGNFVGTDATGTAPIGNGAGVFVDSTTGGLVGGTGAGEGNVVSGNAGTGIVVVKSTRVSLLGNAVFGNGGIAIDLGEDGPTTNDAFDDDDGANGLQNFPEVVDVSGSVAHGTLDSARTTTYRIEIFSSPACDLTSGTGQSHTLLGAGSVTTNSSGHAVFAVHVAALPAGERFVSATATDAIGDTSELAPCTPVSSAVDLAVTASAAPVSAAAGGRLVYTLGVADHGSATATHVVLTDTLPPGTTLVSCAATGGGVCGGTPAVPTVTFASLAPGASATATLVVDVACAAGPVLTDTATVASDDPDANPADDAATTSTAVVVAAPAIACPADVTALGTSVGTDGRIQAVVTFPDPVVTGAECASTPFKVVCSPASGTVFREGTTVVSCTATSGATKLICSFRVTVAFGQIACLVDSTTGDSFFVVAQPDAPLRGFWRYRVAATGRTLSGTATRVSAPSAGRVLAVQLGADGTILMKTDAETGPATGSASVLDRANGGRTLRVRDTTPGGGC